MLVAESPPLDPLPLREEFPILSTVIRGDARLIYFDNAATTQRPRRVIEALVDVYERHYANVHRGVHWLSDQSTDLFEEARETVRAFIGAAEREEIIFTTGTTMAVNLVARSWGDANIREGDEILLTEMEHHSNIVPWQQLAERTGAAVKFAPITGDGRLEMEAFARMIGPRTKLVAAASISNVLGTINPVSEIVKLAHAADAKVLIDAAQSVPHEPTDVASWGADFVAFSGHKLMGPSGVGILYGRRELLEEMPPFLGGGSMIRRVKQEGFEPADLPAKFEAGTPPIAPAIGLGAAIEYLRDVGLGNVLAHEQALVRRAHQVLEDVQGLRILGPAPQHKAGIVSFVLDRPHAHDVAQLLDRRGIAIRAGHHCAMPLHKRLGINASNRASFYLYNTLDEVEKLGEAMHEIKHFFTRK